MGVSPPRNRVFGHVDVQHPTISCLGFASFLPNNPNMCCPRFLGALRQSPVNLPGWMPRGITTVCNSPRFTQPAESKNQKMTTTLSSDNNDLVSLFAHDQHNLTPRFASRLDNVLTARPEAMSPSSTELSDDSTLTNDDLVVLSDLFGFTNSGSTSSTTKPKRATPARPRSRKRPRKTKIVTEDGTVLPKSQQQRQKLEIEYLKRQVVELQATIEDLQLRKLERERREQRREEIKIERNNEWAAVSMSQISTVQQLEEQNEKLRCQVATHLGQLQQLEQMARTRYLANAMPEPIPHPTSTYYSSSC
ncbi:hypothetical protein F444_13396 [Phytophthora nicotianae P1976]|uniref:Uncharacterized protein n=1 Tax=Phytophthora nicotianae P1976 TaxID=1317066 RepID=A0A080ZTZ1_PHYNI|nr:hypothetical protein F444_13396 [Phytophthora nicotianae P1976]